MCNNCSTSRDSAGISFHTFPNKDGQPEKYWQWIYAVNRSNFVPSKYTTVCSIHFTEDDFEIRNKLKLQYLANHTSQPHLKKEAFPSLRLSGPIESNKPEHCKSEYVLNTEKSELLQEISKTVPKCCKWTPSDERQIYHDNSVYAAASSHYSERDYDDHSMRAKQDVRKIPSMDKPTYEMDIQCELGVETLRNNLDTSVESE